MAFKTKEDVYGLNEIEGLVITSTTDGRSLQTVEAQGEDGFAVAHLEFAEKKSPSNNYILTKEVILSSVVLGGTKNVGDKNYTLASITINTGAGSAPSISASGEQVEDEIQVQGCKVTLPAITISPLHHAQTFGAFQVQGQGAHLTQSNLSAQVTIGTSTKDGVVLASDVTDGRMTITGTIVVSDPAYGIPTITTTEGWYVSAPLAESNPDSDFPSYTFTLTRLLVADED